MRASAETWWNQGDARGFSEGIIMQRMSGIFYFPMFALFKESIGGSICDKVGTCEIISDVRRWKT